MIDYADFSLTKDHSYNVYCAIQYCIEQGEDGIRFPKGRYDFYEDMASEKHLCVANHGISGLRRIAFLVDGMHDFTIDGGGSEFVFHGAIIPVAVLNSKNIRLMNYSVDYESLLSIEAKVVSVGDGYAELQPLKEQKWKVEGTTLYSDDGYGNVVPYGYMNLKGWHGENKYMPFTKDIFDKNIKFEDAGNGLIGIYSTIDFKENMCVILQTCARPASGIFVEDSEDVSITNYEIKRSYGMGLLAQKSKNITVDGMTVKAEKGRELSLSGDGVHFVNCRGLVTVKNSSFEEQFDDALNIHGIFTKIVEKADGYIIIRYMHPDTKGINLYKQGSVFQTLNIDTLIPNGRYTVKKAEVINIHCTKLYIEEDISNICVGDVAEDLTHSCDLLFENNRVLNNKGRGMLIAAKGKVVIKNNYFNTPGAAIMFESSGKKWYESGGTTDVMIAENVFENCMYGSSDNWGSAVIDMRPREGIDGKNYYHKRISVESNHFINNAKVLFHANNAEDVAFTGNRIENQISDCIQYEYCKHLNCENNQIDGKITK